MHPFLKNKVTFFTKQRRFRAATPHHPSRTGASPQGEALGMRYFQLQIVNNQQTIVANLFAFLREEGGNPSEPKFAMRLTEGVIF